MAQARQSTENTGRHAVLVAAGILASRLIGLVRQRVFSHFFGLSDTADAFSSALVFMVVGLKTVRSSFRRLAGWA